MRFAYAFCLLLAVSGCGTEDDGSLRTHDVETDPSDPTTPACDGIDNDGDGVIDEGCDCGATADAGTVVADPDAGPPPGCDPAGGVFCPERCGDGLDNDGDGLIDEADCV